MKGQPTFQERREAFAARRGRLVDIREDDSPPSSLCFPVASAAASFDSLDDVGGVGVAGIGDLCLPSTAIGAASSFANPIEVVPPQARGAPSTIVGAASSFANPIEAVPPQKRVAPSIIVGAASSSANPTHPPPQKAKALPGPKTYQNDAHISLHLCIAEQLLHSGVHLITSAPLRKQGKINPILSGRSMSTMRRVLQLQELVTSSTVKGR
jgi:hypothetical protein